MAWYFKWSTLRHYSGCDCDVTACYIAGCPGVWFPLFTGTAYCQGTAEGGSRLSDSVRLCGIHDGDYLSRDPISFPNASPPVPRAHSHVVPIGIIAGATVGGVAALTILVLFGANFLRKCSRGTICDEKPAIQSGASGESSEGNHGIPRLATEPSFRSSAFLIGSEAHGRSSSVSTEISGISTLDVPLAAATPTANAFLRSSLVC